LTGSRSGRRSSASWASFAQRCLLSYSPHDVAPDGWHDITVRLRGATGVVQARPGYLAGF
jgi:hypothetical protein